MYLLKNVTRNFPKVENDLFRFLWKYVYSILMIQKLKHLKSSPNDICLTFYNLKVEKPSKIIKFQESTKTLKSSMHILP
jgi:hypothetical protein